MADEIDAKKQQVIDTAREQVDAGAHYLWSAAGNTPGNKSPFSAARWTQCFRLPDSMWK